MKTVFFREWRANWRGMLIGASALSAFIVMVMAIFPLFSKEMTQMNALFANLGAFTKMFGMDRFDVSSAMAFFGMECGTMISIIGGVYAGMLGISMVAKEEGRRTAEFLFAQPLSRFRILLGKALALVALLCTFSAIVLLFSRLGLVLAQGDFAAGNFLRLMLAKLLMLLQVGLMTFGLSCFLKTEVPGLGIGLAMGLYILALVMQLLTQLKPLRFVTPFYYADYANVYTHGLMPAEILAGYALMLLLLAAGVLYFRRKDLAN